VEGEVNRPQQIALSYLLLPLVFASGAFGCSFFPPSYKVGNTFAVRVSTYDGMTFSGVRVILLRAGRVAKSALTDGQGVARFSAIASAAYSLEIDELGNAGWDTAELDVGADPSSQQIELHWPSSTVLTATELKGKILYSAGSKPFADGYVLLVHAIDGSLAARSLVDDKGVFDLGAPEPGLYFMKLNPPHQGDWEPQGDIAVLVKPEAKRDLTLAVAETSCGLQYSEVCVAPMVTTRRLSGTVTDSNGAEISDATLELWPSNRSDQSSVKVINPDSKGHFYIANVSSGSYSLNVSSTGFAPVIIPVTVDPAAPTDVAVQLQMNVLGSVCSDAKIETISRPTVKSN
jgi:Carboxypeptidase regulatory-like domain